MRQASTLPLGVQILAAANREALAVAQALHDLANLERLERGIALERRITTGIENIDETEVVTGLKAGDRVVTEGFETLRANARVKIIE